MYPVKTFLRVVISAFLTVFLGGEIGRGRVYSAEPLLTCPARRVEKTVSGNSMRPFLENGRMIVLLEGYYRCGNPAQKGDIIAYDYGGNPRPLIKVVRAADGDDVQVMDRRLKINGEILVNSAGEEYVFKSWELKMLRLYVKGGHIPQGSFLIFGDNVSNAIDSRKFGAVSVRDFLGKFETTPLYK